MSDSAQNPTTKVAEDHQMDTPESIEKGKSKMAEMTDDDEESEEDSAAEVCLGPARANRFHLLMIT